jgi:hypothetical protein
MLTNQLLISLTLTQTPKARHSGKGNYIENSILSRVINALTDKQEASQDYLQMVTDFPSKFVAHIENTLSQSGSRKFTEQVKESIEGVRE